jgi:hypothetical protein
MGKKRQKHELGIRLKPTDLTANPQSTDGEISVDSNDNKLKVRLSAGDKSVVTEDQTQTLTNKIIDADVNTISDLQTSNLKAGVLVTNIASATSDTEIPSALAVKTALAAQDVAAEIDYSNGSSGLAAINVQDAIDEVDAKVDEIDVNVNDLITLSGVAENATSLGTFTGVTIPDSSTVKQAAQSLETALESHTGASTGVHGISGSVVGTSDSQTLTNKIVTGADIRTPVRSDVKQDTLANLTTYASSASNGQLCFATDEKAMYQVIDSELAPVGGAGGTTIDITQTAHGFAVGNGVRHNGTSWVKGMSDLATTTSTFVVTEIKSANRFVAYQFGRVEITAHGFTVGEFYFQSNSTAGLATSTEPTSGFSNPLFFVESANFIQVMVFRPSQIGVTISLDELSDVDTSGALSDYVIKYNGSTWYAGVGSTVNALDDLTDVNTTGATNGQFLKYNGSTWVPANTAGSASDITYSNATSGLTATNTQTAIDEVEGRLDTAETSLSSHTSSTTAHGATGAVVGTTNTQTLTNKTLTAPVINNGSATGTSIVTPSRLDVKQDTLANLTTYASTAAEGQLCYATDEDRTYVVTSSLLVQLDSLQDRKYVNDDFRATISDWSEYNDSAALPVDGTGGTTTAIDFTRNTTTPLRGVADGKIALLTASAAGNGISRAFTVDKADTAANYMELNLDYDFTSTGLIFGFFLYDVTNSVLVRASFGETPTALKGRHKALFLANGGTSYRLIIHQTIVSPSGTTNAFIENVTFGPMTSAFNSNVGLVSDYTNLGTMTIGATTTSPTKGTTAVDRIYASRSGQNMLADYQYRQTTAGSAGSGEYLFSLPTGHSFDTSIITPYAGTSFASNDQSASYVGSGQLTLGAQQGICKLIAYSATQFRVLIIKSDSQGAASSAFIMGSTNFTLAESTITSFNFKLQAPILGWSTGITMSTVQKNMIPVIVSAQGNAGTALTASVTPIDFTEVSDSTNSFNGTVFTAQETARFSFDGAVQFNASIGGYIEVYKNGTFLRAVSDNGSATHFVKQFSLTINLIAGDTISFRSSSAATLFTSSSHYLEITKLTNPADMIYPTDKVVARYTTAAGQSIPSSTDTIVNFATKTIDTHNAVTTGASWKFTAPISGNYLVACSMNYASASFTVGNAIYIEIFKNGTFVSMVAMGHIGATATQMPSAAGSDIIDLVKGDYVDIRTVQSEAAARSLSSFSFRNNIAITKI